MSLARQIKRASLPWEVEQLKNKIGQVTFAINDLGIALINAGVLEVEALEGGGHRLVPAKKRRRSLLDRIMRR